jgi:uncharacterized protein (DUF2249 family)
MTSQPIEIGKNPADALEQGGCGSGHVCTCQETDAERIVLDARSIPHAIRHATILGALGSLRPGFSMDLIAPHDPLPLLAQVDREFDHGFEQSYVERAPEKCVVRFTRK